MRKLTFFTLAMCTCTMQVRAEPIQSGRSTYLHHHYHAGHHYEMTHRNHRNDGLSYGVGSGGAPRTTATGGNPGGYSSRN